MRSAVDAIVDNPRFNRFIGIVIAINAVTIGLETSPWIMSYIGPLLIAVDRIALAIFITEIGLKLFAKGFRFFRSGWNVFDFVIVTVALAPFASTFSVLRALRILRALRLISVVPKMRAVVNALFDALPGMGAIVAVLGLIFYVAGVMATKLFGGAFPDWFGSIGASMYTLFQVMTLESWSMGIVRPVMETYAWAWIFFVPFIIVTSFAVLNLFIALIVNSMQSIHDADVKEATEKSDAIAHREREALMQEILALRSEIRELRQSFFQR
ncbi:ion transporter [Rhizobium sp. L1K21]|nr:ion transporter [Rhizobium sp. L1K21]